MEVLKSLGEQTVYFFFKLQTSYKKEQNEELFKS